MDNNMTKLSADLQYALQPGQEALFIEKFAELGGDYLHTKIREESIAEKILNVKKVDENHNQVQVSTTSDTLYYLEEIEQDAIAMEVAMRADSKPRFVDGKRYTIPIGKIESESVKKPKMELRVAKNIVKFLRENNADAIRRTQDAVFMRTVRAGIGVTGTAIGVDTDDYNDYVQPGVIDWSAAGPQKVDFVNLKNTILAKELKPARWLMSSTAYNAISGMDAGEIGDLSGDMLSKGFSGELLELPIVETIKTTLEDPMGLYGDRMFDYEDDTGYYTDIYLFVEPKFLGHLIKVDDDAIWSRWEKDVFEWMSWRYCGLGLGDVRGMAMMRIKLA